MSRFAFGPFTLEQLPDAAKALLDAFPQARVFAFHGQLGAGKTTLIKALCIALGVKDHTSSPSFALVNTYESAHGPVHHYDLYRLRNAQEAFDAGLEEAVWSGEFCFIEWPERAEELLPEDGVNVFLEIVGEERNIKAG
ncbi:MAG: tRNA (adenosine(37)-N6)-threonylcarbamoyltransferase complex ATPase subunit type 1 TsaE [Bacteroidia bacterium]|jgi:tRNA threonylcarbamoyladenosine biosynthesis protein TsaE|nr:tRNA (adenosine(37)-N6)-threonylcarbamoyltransferase complex ATPase subunit type 1 TsaE [Bacteroidia bacterium]